MSLLVDGRREEALAQEMLRRAEAVLGLTGEPVEPGRIETAILTVAARISEEVTRRLDKVPDKQADNFYSAVGIGRDPARPARIPVAFKLSDTAPADLDAPAGTKLQASTGTPPTIFETDTGINLARGSIARLVAVDARDDKIFVAVPTVPQAELPAVHSISRILTAGAGAGAKVLQISPATGLAPGGSISIVTAAGAAEYGIAKVDGDLVTVEPPLASPAAEGAVVTDVVQFAPYEAGARNRQSHTLYLSHATLLDVPSEVKITVSGLEIGQVPKWSWYGKLDEDDPEPSWIEFKSAEPLAGRWTLEKTAGKPEKSEIGGRSGLWIRARLEDPSKGPDKGQSIRLSVVSGGACEGKEQEQRCEPPADRVEYEAIAVTTPVVPNKPYYPFGREPRLFDSFYVGSKEAFGKAGAEISLCFELGGPALGGMAAISDGNSVEAYGVGTDGLLWRAVIDPSGARISQVPGPAYADGQGFPQQAYVAAQLTGGKVRLAIADKGAVHVAKFDYGSLLPEGAVAWTQLTDGPDEPAEPVTAIFLSNDSKQTIHALAGNRILTWVDGSAVATPIPNAVDLIPVQDEDEALLITWDGEAESSDWKVQLKRSTTDALEDIDTVSPDDFARTFRTAWKRPRTNQYYIAGFDTDDRSVVIAEVKAGEANVTAGTALPQRLTFDQVTNVGADWPPAILVANPSPVVFIPIGKEAYRDAPHSDIGLATKTNRQFLSKGGWTLVQHADQGLLYRKSFGGHTIGERSFRGVETVALREPDVPADSVFLTFKEEPDGDVFYLAPNLDGDRLAIPLTDTATVEAAEDAVFFGVQDPDNPITVDVSGSTVEIGDDDATSDVDILLSDASTTPAKLTAWHLVQDGTSWKKPAGFPGGANLSCFFLDKLTGPSAPSFEPHFLLADESLPDALATGPLSSFYDSQVELTKESVDRFESPEPKTLAAVPLAADLADGTVARFALATDPWNSLGPNQPANPALSWEYWNGSSWWALDPEDLSDRTANLQLSDGVFFTVPEDLQETEVGGRTNRWIRARLVGGDYGEARVIVRTETVPDGKGGTGTVDQQTVTRDLSAIRAPHIVNLNVGYCATRAVRPEIILTADNLGIIDQTSANDADLPVQIFPPVSSVLNPNPIVEATAPTEECCERWPEPPPEISDPPTPAPLNFDRAFLIALDQKPVPGLLSIYFALAPGGDRANSLTASVFRGGGFENAEIRQDGTSGFTERGAVAIDIDNPPDLVQLFGTTAYWLRIAAEGDARRWSPRVRGVYLNVVLATSVESRSLETIGTSSGAPDQSFSLAAPPIAAESLTLMVAEPIGADEAADRGAEEEIAGMPGPWVPWRQVDHFPEHADEPDRIFTIDAQSGTILFGNGSNGLVPPIGSAILAKAYRHVTGLDANFVESGAELQTVGPLVGLDKVFALDSAQGGVDVEQPELARKRASAKMRHQGRIVSLADVEDFVLARVASIAQVRASNWTDGVRLVVVGSGENPVPVPSALRAIEDAVGSESTARLRASGMLRAVAPRLLPIDVELEFDPDRGVDWVTLEGDAQAAIIELLDHQRGGFDGRGWPVGMFPSEADISAAVEALADRGTLVRAYVKRTDGRPIPDPFPADVLVRVHSEPRIEQTRKAAA